MDLIVLIEQLKRKEENGIAALYDYYAPPLYGVILCKAANEQEAEEILQQTFITVIDEIHLLKDRSFLFSWMVSVARLIALKNSAKKPPSENPVNSLAEFGLDEKPDKELLSGINPASKKIVQFVYLENRTVLETSLLLGLSTDEVRVLLRAALGHINQRIKLLYQL